MTSQEKEKLIKSMLANFGWSFLAGANAVPLFTYFSLLEVPLFVPAGASMLALHPGVGLAGVATVSGIEGIRQLIKLMK